MKRIFCLCALFFLLAVHAGCNTLDEAYDQGGPGIGRAINADAAAVSITGPDGLTVEGNVGINTLSPTARLHVSGQRGSVDFLRVQTGPTGGENALRVHKDGLVSIGTAFSPGAKLDVRVNAIDGVHTVIMTGSNPGPFIPRIGIYAQSSNCTTLATDSETRIGIVGDTGCMSESLAGIKAGVYATTKTGTSTALIANSNTTKSSSDIARFQNQGSTKVIITNSGNVGISTTGPNSKLQVKDGDVYVETIGSGIILRSQDGSCFRVTVNNDGTFASAGVTCP